MRFSSYWLRDWVTKVFKGGFIILFILSASHSGFGHFPVLSLEKTVFPLNLTSKAPKTGFFFVYVTIILEHFFCNSD